jgi:hypothetical protein
VRIYFNARIRTIVVLINVKLIEIYFLYLLYIIYFFYNNVPTPDLRTLLAAIALFPICDQVTRFGRSV